MQIVDFDYNHMERAIQIAKANYEEERAKVPMLPEINSWPDLEHFAENKLGVVAFEGNQMIGYLCCYLPIDDAFHTTGARGTFSPIHAHGVTGENRDRVYSKLYQAAAEKWVKEGIISHAIALYAHDKATMNSFFYNGFGLRCIDAICMLEEIVVIENSSLNYVELPKEEWGILLELHNLLIAHLGCSPTFMSYPSINEEEFFKRTGEDTRFFAVKDENCCIAFIKIGAEGENFACNDSSMMNICGAYCLPEYRGTGVYHNLLAYLISVLKSEGYQRLGVDFESINPNACGFWFKYFTEYTNSVVRRIDEKR